MLRQRQGLRDSCCRCSAEVWHGCGSELTVNSEVQCKCDSLLYQITPALIVKNFARTRISV